MHKPRKLFGLFCGLMDKICGKTVYSQWLSARISQATYPHYPQPAAVAQYSTCAQPQNLTTTVPQLSSVIFRPLTDGFRYLSTLSTPPITTTNNI